MPMFVNSNANSLNSQRHLNKANRNLSRSFERLSSGLRINSAADDAAGMAISKRMHAQVRSLNTAIRNGNDGVSLIQTAESALSESSNILTRMRELAVQATNDTNTNADRASLQTEVGQLITELNRIGDQTEFNTQTLLDGTYSGKDFHIGFREGQTISLSINDMRGSAIGARATATAAHAASAAAFTASDMVINGTAIGASVSTDDTLSTSLASSGAIAKAAAINAQSGLTGVTASVKAASVTGAAVTSGGVALLAGDLVINSEDIGAVTGIASLDAGGVLTAAINAKSAATGVTATLNETTGVISLSTSDGRNIHISAQNQAANYFTTDVYQSSLELTSNDDFVISGTNASARGGITATLYTRDTADSVSAINISTKSGANNALAVLDSAIDKVASSRGGIGALQNRLESTISNLQSVSENLSSARSRVEDADFAAETAQLTRTQILQQAGVAMLAQANSSPQVVLALLS